MTPVREMSLTVGALAAGGFLALVAAGQPRLTGGGGPGLGGSLDAPAARALALVALAGAGALLLASRRVRVAIGLLLLVTGGGVVATSFLMPEQVAWFSYAADPPDPTWSAWAWLTAAGGAMVCAGALLTVLRCHGWPAPRRRYDAPAAPRRGAPADTWEAQDRGEDPTA